MIMDLGYKTLCYLREARGVHRDRSMRRELRERERRERKIRDSEIDCVALKIMQAPVIGHTHTAQVERERE